MKPTCGAASAVGCHTSSRADLDAAFLPSWLRHSTAGVGLVGVLSMAAFFQTGKAKLFDLKNCQYNLNAKIF